MRAALFLVFLATVLCLPLASNRAPAQSTPQPNTPPADNQWLSHQMNQPPPADNAKYSISQERVDEIVQLYQQAKKEQEAKAAANKAQPQKPQSTGK